MQFANGALSGGAKFRRELNFAAALAVRMEDGSTRDGDAEHLLQTQRLGAELRVVILPLAALAQLELDRPEGGDAARFEI